MHVYDPFLFMSTNRQNAILCHDQTTVVFKLIPYNFRDCLISHLYNGCGLGDRNGMWKCWNAEIDTLPHANRVDFIS